jgi:Na+/citrate or Na+/malate symporter
MDDKKINLLLLFSSFIFITNTSTNFHKKYYIYSFLFFCLTITSLCYHYNNNIYTNILDKFFILAVVLYGAYSLYNKTTQDNKFNVSLIIITFLLCILLYIYGYTINDFCFHQDEFIGNNYHCAIHIITSLGHHFITFL